MAIMSVVEKNDARASARVLARTTKRCIDGQLESSAHRIELANMFRLLNAFRAHRFAGHEYEQRAYRSPEALSLMPSSGRNVVDLGVALNSALSDVYRGEDPAEAIEKVDFVLREVAKSHDLDEEDKKQTIRFFDTLIERLSAN